MVFNLYIIHDATCKGTKEYDNLFPSRPTFRPQLQLFIVVVTCAGVGKSPVSPVGPPICNEGWHWPFYYNG